jgi:DNA replication initiation complex subunit (GINS family)
VPDHFSQLLEWRRNEAATRTLAKIPHDFFATTTAYLADVRRSYEIDLRENPSGRKGEISRQTYQRAGQAARDIVEGRTQKILTFAFQASIGGGRDLPNALPEERALYDQLVQRLLEFRRASAPYMETPPAPSGAAAPPVAVPAPLTPPTPPAPPAAVAPRPAARTANPVYVRVLQDGRPIEVGPDTIDLRREDVVSLPPDTAQLLVRAKVAEPIEPGTARSGIT